MTEEVKRKSEFIQNGKQIAFFQVSKEFLEDCVNFRANEVKIYNLFMNQLFETGKKEIKLSLKQICNLTGIKEDKTVRLGIRNLIIHGWISKIQPEIDNSYTYTIHTTKQKPNVDLLKWLVDRGAKQSKNSKKAIKEKKMDRDEKGKFIKSELVESK